MVISKPVSHNNTLWTLLLSSDIHPEFLILLYALLHLSVLLVQYLPDVHLSLSCAKAILIYFVFGEVFFFI